MLRTSTFWPVATICLFTLAGSALAQQTPSSASPGSAPPKLEKIEDGSDTPITVTAKPSSGKKITEKRQQGRVTEVTVQSGGSKYTMRPNTPAGSALPGDAQSSAVRAPQWTVMEFNVGKKVPKEKEEPVASVPPPPPPVE